MDQYLTFIQANAILSFSVPFRVGGFSDLTKSLAYLKKGYIRIRYNRFSLQLKQNIELTMINEVHAQVHTHVRAQVRVHKFVHNFMHKFVQKFMHK